MARTPISTPEEGLNQIDRSLRDIVRTKIQAVKPDTFKTWDGSALKAWRERDPKIKQDVLAKVLGVTRPSVAGRERRGLLTSTYIERLEFLHHLLTNESAQTLYICEDTGLTPEEEIAQGFSVLRTAINKFRPLVGKGRLDPRLEGLLEEFEGSIHLFRQATALSRAAYSRRRKLQNGNT